MASSQPEALPEALGELVGELEARGFVITRDEVSESLRARFLELSRRTHRVQVVHDRGTWSAEIEVAEELFNPYDVVQALNDAPYSTRALSHEEHRRFMLEALDRLPEDDAGLAMIHQRLLAFRKEYNRRLGVEVDSDVSP